MTVERSPSGRIASVTLRWFGGSKTLTGHQFRMLIGPSKLRSLNWSPNSPVKDDNDFTITTYGWGHGVGMSQVSAYAMAAIHTMDYREILEKSYPGAELVRLWR
jgi:SpoIID/LytB domain protein